ncbi:heparinase II/III family protein [Citricoccus nitrophenolicus]|uniref:Heparinase II/III family protein n=1 Tax=Citricoccus nitrophenolicus TaxID=863575 RepID=A0ABV0IFQ6_9MICC
MSRARLNTLFKRTLVLTVGAALVLTAPTPSLAASSSAVPSPSADSTATATPSSAESATASPSDASEGTLGPTETPVPSPVSQSPTDTSGPGAPDTASPSTSSPATPSPVPSVWSIPSRSELESLNEREEGTDVMDLEAELEGIDAAEEKAAAANAANNPNAVYPCQAYGQLPRYNTVASNQADVYNWYIFPSTKVGDGKGNINWNLDPHRDTGWRLWLASLRWIGPSIEAGRDGNTTALNKAEVIIRDWIRDHPGSWLKDHDDIEANTHRLNTLLCFREVVMERNGGSLPSSYGWLTDIIHRHAEHNIARWSGAWNHGSMENRALLGAGCLLGRRDYQDHAISRVKQALPIQISPEGLSNEAAPHYMLFNYRLIMETAELMERCGHSTSSISPQLTTFGNNMAHFTNNLGYYWQFGDSPIYQANRQVPSEALYAATDGQQGKAPRHRVRTFLDAGYIQGRASWGDSTTGFRDYPSWMLRAGTGKEKKAHKGDLLQFLYTARGRDVLVDAGHPGIVSSKWRGWAMSELAHNTIYIPSSKMSAGGPAKITRYNYPAAGWGDFAEVTQRFSNQGNRTRGTLVMDDPDVAVVLDRTVINDRSKTHTVQTLWNLPPDQRSEWVNRSVVRSSAPGSSTQTTFVQVPFWGPKALSRGETALYHAVENPHPRGHYYPQEQVRVPTDQISFGRHGNSVGTISVIAPARKSARVSVSSGKYADGATKLTIRIGSDTVVVRITRGGWMSRQS